MNRISLFKNIIYSSAFLAGVPAILIMLFLHPLGSRYTLLTEQTDKQLYQFQYADLNSDGISEMIYTGKGIPFHYIVVKNLDYFIYDQWNLKDQFDPQISEFFVGNYDHDQASEIYVFTHRQDSLFLNINEMLEPSAKRIERIFISKIGYLDGELSAAVMPAGFFDTNGDGMDELYFSVSSAFQLGPRRLYSYDIVNNKLNSSKFGASIILFPHMFDSDNDGRPEIYGILSASGNYPRYVQYTDSSTWFMIFDDKLNFKFPPEEFPGFANALHEFPYENGDTQGWLLSHIAGGADTTILKSRIMLYSTRGKLLRSRVYKDFINFKFPILLLSKSKQKDKIFIFENRILEMNNRLEVINSTEMPFSLPVSIFQTDINADSLKEFLLYSDNEKKLAVYSSDMIKLTETDFKTQDEAWKFSPYINKDHEFKLYMSSGQERYFLTMKKNNYYLLGFLAYPGIYLLFFVFIILIKKINTSQIRQREGIKERLITLQLQGIKAQLDPHFTFNTLNSVASLIYLEDRETAYDYMNKFTRLLRGMLQDAERVYRSLGEELEFVITYLDLEKLRFAGRLNYEIEIGDGVGQHEQVPKLVLQTFAENAVKHGIIPRIDGGKLKIKVIKEDDYLKLTVEDNGIGRAMSAGKSTSTGKGLKITSEFYDILNQMNKKKIRHLITDLYNDNGDPAGTRVDVWVPLQ